MYYKFENFRENLFSRIALKDIFATLKLSDYGMIYMYISGNDSVISPFRKGNIFMKLRICEICEVSRK